LVSELSAKGRARSRSGGHWEGGLRARLSGEWDHAMTNAFVLVGMGLLK